MLWRKRRRKCSPTSPSIRSTIPMRTPKISSRRTPAMPCSFLRTARSVRYASESACPSSRGWPREVGEKSLTRAISNRYRRRHVHWVGLACSLAMLLNGCNSSTQPAYQDKQGFRFTPPPGWVERARDDALPAKSGHRQPDLPLPKLAGPGGTVREHLLVRYD